MKLKNLLLTVSLTFATQVFATNYTGWYSRDIVINPTSLGIGATVSNFPLLVRLNTGNFTFSQSLSTWTVTPVASRQVGHGGGDIRFTAGTGTDTNRTDLFYQMEDWDTTSMTADFWVLVPAVSNTANTTIKMYWGKTGQTTPPVNHDGTSVFSGSNVSDTIVAGCTANTFINATGCGFLTVHNAEFAPKVDLSVWDPSSTNLINVSGGDGDLGSKGTVDAVLVNGIIGKGISYNGSTFTTIGGTKNKLDFVPYSNYTFSAWVQNTAATPISARIIAKWHEFYLGTSSDGLNWEMGEYPDTVLAGKLQRVRVPITTGWTHLMGVRKGTAMSLYVNGTTSSSTITIDTTSTVRGPSLTSSQTYGVGCQPISGSTAEGYFTGYIDEVRIENVARNSDWALLNYATQKATVTAVTYGTVTSPTAITSHSPGASPAIAVMASGAGLMFRLPASDASVTELTVTDVWGRTVWATSLTGGAREASWNGKSGKNGLAYRGVYLLRARMFNPEHVAISNMAQMGVLTR